MRSHSIGRLFRWRLMRSPLARRLIYPLLLAGLWFYFGAQWLHAGPTNGFDLSGALVPASRIEHGGPLRDGIPAIDRPRFIPASQAAYLRERDRVLGIELEGVQKAYPVRILNYHEIVNDRFADTAVVVSYCPLCGTGMAFLAGRNGEVMDFGVSGLLYNSDMLLYDRQTESLWSQIRRQAIAGPLKGRYLEQIALQHTSWADWRQRYPDTQVLSRNTGYRRDYNRTPYPGYTDSERLMFAVSHTDRRFHPKEQVIGVQINGVAKAYPFQRLAQGPAEIEDSIGGQPVRVVYDAAHRSARAYAGERLLPSTTGFWFAWVAFHPNTEVYQPHQ